MRRVTIPELIGRGKQAILARAEASLLFRKVVLSSGVLLRGDISQGDSLASLERLMPWPVDELKAIASATWEPQRSEQVAAMLDGNFSLLGIQSLSFGKPIDWHLEPISGRRSPMVPWKKLDSLDPSLTGDKKIVWELNRHQHLFAFAREFVRTGDDRYAQAVIDHIESWIKANPRSIGINWVSSLELAFRCISWLWALSLLRSWQRWPELRLTSIIQSIAEQAAHIARYLSTYSSPNTHLTGEALGLYYIGCCVPELAHATRWRELGRAILLREIELQVLADGVYFERATWYHRYTADFYCHFLMLAERFADPLPPTVTERVASLLEHLMWLARPDGTSPNIGDDDGGKLMMFDPFIWGDWRAALSNGAAMFGRADFKIAAGALAEETRWLCGAQGESRFNEVSARAPSANSKAFPVGGYFIMRSGWSNVENYLSFDCGPHGVMNCGHAHSDALSIEVASNGETMIVDPGTCSYTGSAESRDLYRSTAMHNTLTVDGQSASISAGPFRWDHIAKVQNLCWHDHADFTFVSGKQDGYLRLSDPVMHARSLFFPMREYWIVLDQVAAAQEHAVAVHFHAAPGIKAEVANDAGRLSLTGERACLDIVFPEQLALRGQWELVTGKVSPCYGSETAAPYATYRAHPRGSLDLLAVMLPRRLQAPVPIVTASNSESGTGLVVVMGEYRDVILRQTSRSTVERLIDSNCEWVWVRRRTSSDTFSKLIVMHGALVAIDGLSIKADRRLEFMVITLHGETLTIELSSAAQLRVLSSISVTCVIVNGVAHQARQGSELIVPAVQAGSSVASPGVASNEYCDYVRH
jgi:hypothetical protein